MRNTEPPERGDWATLVRTVRAAAGVSGAELARRLKVDRATIWRWETGKQRVESLALVQAFAEVFGLDLAVALAAAQMAPVDPAQPPPPVDADLAKLMALLADPTTPAATAEQIRQMLRALADLADQLPRAPKRRKAAG
jgi:transcriptional regulator with XRE-family HTH domain